MSLCRFRTSIFSGIVLKIPKGIIEIQRSQVRRKTLIYALLRCAPRRSDMHQIGKQ